MITKNKPIFSLFKVLLRNYKYFVNSGISNVLGKKMKYDEL